MQRRFTLPAPLRFALVVVIAVLLATVIDPYVDLTSSLQVQVVNAIVPLLIVLLVWALCGRAWMALLVEALLLGVLVYANNVKVLYLDTDLVYADFTILQGLLSDPSLVLGFVHPTVRKVVAGIAVLVFAVVGAWLMRRQRKAGWKFRVSCLVLALAGCVTIGVARVPDVIHSLHWEVFQQAVGARRVGVTGNILLGRMTARDIKRPPDAKAIAAFWQEPSVRRARQGLATQGNGLRPDIVVVQSESLFDPSRLCGFPDTPILKHVAAQQPTMVKGNLHVPVFGGRTLQTEFEVLSGAPIAYYPGSMFAYYELVDHQFNALPHVLDADGYKTVAIHPNRRGYWRRDMAFPRMGFDTFQDLGSFVYPRDFSERGHVSDVALTRAILAELDSSNRATFVMAVSMNNHGPWGQYAPKDDAGLHLPAKVSGEARAELADYVEHAIDADNAYGFLLDALQRRDRPTVVVFYGDHLPALPKVYGQLCFKDGRKPQAHSPPYRIWANFPMPTPPATTSAYLLQGWLMHVAGLPLKGHVLANFLAGKVAHDPSIAKPVRQRVLDEYANIAAANVAAKVPSTRDADTVFVSRDKALSVLMDHQQGQAKGISVNYNDLYFQPSEGAPVRATFHLDGALASLSLRPYLRGTSMSCRDQAMDVQFRVDGDGRELYRASLSSKTFRLATLDVQGVRQLSITVQDTGAGGKAKGARCSEVVLNVPQMLCYSAACDTPGPKPDQLAPPSRTLTNDPAKGDIAHLASMKPLARRQVSDKMQNLHWMLGHKTGKQKGYADFKVQRDAQLFMHPGGDHPAWMDFDVTGLSQVTLSPRINKLDQHCLSMDKPKTRVGVVGVSLSLDGKPLRPRFIVDPNYHQNPLLDVKGGHTLRISVDKGNQVAWCDWFSVGFPSLRGPAVDKPATSVKTP